ncbi:MAG: ubiquinol-cytochrome c reductase iron-sulfur subunit [Chloroflexota bacterium]
MAKEKKLSRREMLRLAWWGAAGALVLEGVGATLLSLWPKVQAGAFGGRIEAGNVDEFPLGSVTYHMEGRCYVSHVRTADGGSGLLALYRRCTHLGCVVPWRADEASEDDLSPRGRFTCPCHASIFDRYGRVKGGPAPRPLDMFPVTLQGHRVLVDTGKVVQRASYDDAQVARV